VADQAAQYSPVRRIPAVVRPTRGERLQVADRCRTTKPPAPPASATTSFRRAMPTRGLRDRRVRAIDRVLIWLRATVCISGHRLRLTSPARFPRHRARCATIRVLAGRQVDCLLRDRFRDRRGFRAALPAVGRTVPASHRARQPSPRMDRRWPRALVHPGSGWILGLAGAVTAARTRSLRERYWRKELSCRATPLHELSLFDNGTVHVTMQQIEKLTAVERIVLRHQDRNDFLLRVDEKRRR